MGRPVQIDPGIEIILIVPEIRPDLLRKYIAYAGGLGVARVLWVVC